MAFICQPYFTQNRPCPSYFQNGVYLRYEWFLSGNFKIGRPHFENANVGLFCEIS